MYYHQTLNALLVHRLYNRRREADLYDVQVTFTDREVNSRPIMVDDSFLEYRLNR